MTAHTSWTRPAIDLGNRWRAGFSLNTAARASGSMAARAATSRWPPSRSRRSKGDRNARSSGTCWSRTMAMTSARGSSESSWSTASSPVTWITWIRLPTFADVDSNWPVPGLSRSRGRRSPGRCRTGRWPSATVPAGTAPSAARLDRTATTTWAASTSKNRRRTSRVSDRPNPSVPSEVNRRGIHRDTWSGTERMKSVTATMGPPDPANDSVTNGTRSGSPGWRRFHRSTEMASSRSDL